MRRFTLLSSVFISTLFAQHEYTPAEIENGGQLFRQNCIGCHGPDGNQIAGIDLLRSRFQRAFASDDDIVKLIRAGVPGSTMLASTQNEANVGMIVAYMRSVAAAPGASVVRAGDPARGKGIFEGKGNCLSCHRVAAVGAHLGPDLSAIGSARRTGELERSLLDPNAEVAAANRFVRAVTRNGETILGRVLNIDSYTIQMIDRQDKLRSLDKTTLREYALMKESGMPSMQGRLSAQEIADIVGYLASLRSL